MPRGLTACLLALGLLLAGGAARAASPCDAVFVPEQTGLVCAEDDAGAVVSPMGGAFADLSRLYLRRLDEAADPQAWQDPAGWLESRLVLDLDLARAGIEGLADDPDNPFGRGGMTDAIGHLFEMLEGLGSMALAGCMPVTVTGGGGLQSCEWGIGPVGLKMENRLVAAGEARYAITLWTMNERRLRHLQAIANSFEPPA